MSDVINIIYKAKEGLNSYANGHLPFISKSFNCKRKWICYKTGS